MFNTSNVKKIPFQNSKTEELNTPITKERRESVMSIKFVGIAKERQEGVPWDVRAESSR